MNFVALWTATSAPSSSGRCSSGVEKRGVDGDRGAGGVRALDEAVELGDADQRVGRRLDPQQRGARRTARSVASVSVTSTSSSSIRPAAARSASSIRTPV